MTIEATSSRIRAGRFDARPRDGMTRGKGRSAAPRRTPQYGVEVLEDRVLLAQVLNNPSFSSGAQGWTLSGYFWAGTTLTQYRTSPGYAAGGANASGGVKNNANGSMSQQVTIPSNATAADLRFWYFITTDEAATAPPDDRLAVQLTGTSAGTVLLTQISNRDATTGYVQTPAFSLLPWKGQTFNLTFAATTDGSRPTALRMDDVTVDVTTAPPPPNLAPYSPPGWSAPVVASTGTGTNIDSGTIYSDQAIYVDWAQINNGPGPTAARFLTNLYVDGVVNAGWNTDPPFNSNSSRSFSDHNIGTLSPGTHTLKLVTDVANALAETSETDNAFTKTITVASRTGSIGGVVWNDLNANGIQEGNEPGMSGWTVFLDANENGARDGGEASATSGSVGDYHFPGLAPGRYVVAQERRAGWVQTRPRVTAGAPVTAAPVAALVSGGAPPAPVALGVAAESAPQPASIEGINIDASGYFPPDPHGAAGPAHIVSVVNAHIQWHTKSGALQSARSLASFFAPLSPVTATFDPKVIYDPHANRFVVVTLERTATATANFSRIMLAVSDDADPNGTWHQQAIDARQTIGGLDTWADYPGLAVDAQAVYVTANMATFSGTGIVASRLWIVGKSGLYSGGSGTVTAHDPSTAVALGGQAFTLQPAAMYGTAPGAVGTFLVSSNWSVGTIDQLSVIRVDNPLTAPAFSNQFIPLGDLTELSVPTAPQRGGTTNLHSGDLRVLHAVWRDNSLYAVNTINPSSGPDAGQATAHWYRINTGTLASLSLADQGNIGGEDLAPGTSTFYPAVAVDSLGNVGFGFSASGPAMYGSAAYTGRLAADPPGTVQPSVIFAAGEDYYVRVGSLSRNRWGDYSGISVDPADGSTFWLFNEYALPAGINGSRWGTRWTSFSLATLPSGAYAVNLSAGQNVTGRDFGNLQNSPPTIDSFSASPATVYWNGSISLSATASDPEGSLFNVSFYAEFNGTPGLQYGDGGDWELAFDTNAPYGVEVYADDLGPGKHTFYAVATDNPGSASGVAAATSTVQPNQRPTVGSFTGTPDPVAAGDIMTLSATASDPEGAGVNVLFYRETNGTGGLQAGGIEGDLLLYDDFTSPYGVDVATSGLTDGTYTYYAIAYDGGDASNPAAITHRVAPTVTVTRRRDSIEETQPSPAEFTFARTGSTAQPLVVAYTIAEGGAHARNGVDYDLLSGSFTIPAGAADAVLGVMTRNDVLLEGDETVALTLAPAGHYAVGASGTASATITDDEATDPVASSTETVRVPEGQTATFTVWLTFEPERPLTVSVAGPGGDPDLTLVSGGTLAFTRENWQQPQTVTLAAAADSDRLEGSRSFLVGSPISPSFPVVAVEVEPNQRPSGVEIVPNPASDNVGVFRTFTARYRDADGAADIDIAYLRVFNPSTGRSLIASYDGATDKLYLLADDGVTLLGGFAPGSANTITNSLGTLDTAGTSLSRAGDTLTFNWRVSAKAPLAGSDSLQLLCRDRSLAWSGWTAHGSWSVLNPANSVPIGVGITPNAASDNAGVFRTFTAQYRDADGAADIDIAYLRVFNPSTGKALTAVYYGPTNKLYLVAEDGVTLLGGFAPGSANTVTNTLGTLDTAGTSLSRSGDTLTVNWRLSTKAPLAGANSLVLYTRDRSMAWSAWTTHGTWTIG